MELEVREMGQGEKTARQAIVRAATEQLRRIYEPIKRIHRASVDPGGILVALNQSIVVGTLEYLHGDDHLYLQGVAVHPRYRRMGVCRALFGEAKEIATRHEARALGLRTIEETGNRSIFEKLGFIVSGREISPSHVGWDGGPVTQLEMRLTIR